MTPERQTEAIALLCPNVAVKDCEGQWVWKDWPVRKFFNPLSDLNAMHEAEKVITVDREISEYIKKLSYLSTDSYLGTCHATAAQRAEAFLRVVGKWEEP